MVVKKASTWTALSLLSKILQQEIGFVIPAMTSSIVRILTQCVAPWTSLWMILSCTT